jgi:hypothetical protein
MHSYHQLTLNPSKFLGRVEAKHDRIEKGKPIDSGHQTAIDDLARGVKAGKEARVSRLIVSCNVDEENL